MPSTFFEHHPRTQAAIRAAVAAVARGGRPADTDLLPAIDHDYLVIETGSDNEMEIVLTDKGFAAAQRWLGDDSHGGDAG